MPPITDGSRVVFLGDSLTQAGQRRPDGYVNVFRDDLQAAWPNKTIEIMGAGVSGNKIYNLLSRLERDVLSKKPTHVVVFIGINDAWHWKPYPNPKEEWTRKGTSEEGFEKGLKELIGKVRNAGANVLLCTPSTIGEKTDGSNPYDPLLDTYAAISRRVATDEKTGLLDLRKIFLDELKRINPQQKDRHVLTRDGVHLRPAGNRLVADMMLDALGVPRGKTTSMFNGKDLTGWHNPYDWGEAKAVDGEIHLIANRKFFLCTDRPYSNFIFEVELFMPNGKANSGIMFRCHVEKNSVFGYQAEVDPSDRAWSGGLYDEGRRQWLHPDKKDKKSIAAFRKQAGDCFKPGEWNRYRVWCQGSRLRIYVNHVKTTDVVDDMDASGYIALQHHGEKGQLYRFRSPQIRELP